MGPLVIFHVIEEQLEEEKVETKQLGLKHSIQSPKIIIKKLHNTEIDYNFSTTRDSLKLTIEKEKEAKKMLKSST